MLAVAMLTSKGAAGVSGAGFITLAATLGSIHPDARVEGKGWPVKGGKVGREVLRCWVGMKHGINDVN